MKIALILRTLQSLGIPSGSQDTPWKLTLDGYKCILLCEVLISLSYFNVLMFLENARI